MTRTNTRILTAIILLVLSLFALVTWHVVTADAAPRDDGFFADLRTGETLHYYWDLNGHTYQGQVRNLFYHPTYGVYVEVWLNVGYGWEREEWYWMLPTEGKDETESTPALVAKRVPLGNLTASSHTKRLVQFLYVPLVEDR